MKKLDQDFKGESPRVQLRISASQYQVIIDEVGKRGLSAWIRDAIDMKLEEERKQDETTKN